MKPAFTIFELSGGHVVVELHEDLTRPGPALELHLVACADGEPGVAWWELEDGKFAKAAIVGTA